MADGVGFDFQAARKAGYSDAEIVQFLASDKDVKFDVDGALKAGYSPKEILDHLNPTERSAGSGLVDAARQGAANVVSGLGETLKQYTPATDVAAALKTAGGKIAPENYQASPIVTNEGVQAGNIPRALAEQAPGMAAGIAVARKTPGPAWLKALAGAGVYAGIGLGNRATERAAENGNAEPSTTDKAVAAGAMIPEAALSAIGVGRFLGKAAGSTVADAAKRLATTTGVEGVVGAGQSAINQAGRTIGTDKGLSVDPVEMANAAATNAVAGGALASPRAVAESHNAVKYREFGGDNADASAAVANRIKGAAGDDNLGNTKVGFKAVTEAARDVKTELSVASRDALKDTTLAPEVRNALVRARAGKELTGEDATHLKSVSPDIELLAKQASVISKLKTQGDYRTSAGKFGGGLSSKMEKGVRLFYNPTGALTAASLSALGLSGLGAGAMGYAAPTIAALGGAYGGARILDKLTGARSPAKQFTNRFADNARPMRLPAPQPAPPPAAPSLPITGPKIGPVPTPWGQPTPPAGTTPQTNLMLHTGMAKVANQIASQKKAQMVAQAAPLLQQLAATGSPPPPAPQEPTAVPKDVLTNTRALVRGLQSTQALKSKTLGTAQADAVGRTSPLVQDNGGFDAISNPDTGKRLSQLASAASAMKKLTAVPEEEGATKPAKIKKTNGKIVEQPAPKLNGSANGNGAAGEPFNLPLSPYAHLSPEQAASARVQDMVKGGAPPFLSERYRVGIIKRIGAIRGAADLVGKESPEINTQRIAGAFEGVSRRADAIALREKLKDKFPSAAASLDQHFTDAHIKRIWRK